MFEKLNKKLFLIVLGSVFVGIVLAVVGSAGVNATKSDSFCLNCHDAPEFTEKREITPHGKISCLSCHGDGFVKDKVAGMGHLWNTVSGKHDPNNYDDIQTEVVNEKCLTCHNINNISRGEAVINMHEGFIEEERKCIECHDAEFMHGVLENYATEK